MMLFLNKNTVTQTFVLHTLTKSFGVCYGICMLYIFTSFFVENFNLIIVLYFLNSTSLFFNLLVGDTLLNKGSWLKAVTIYLLAWDVPDISHNYQLRHPVLFTTIFTTQSSQQTLAE